MGAHERSFQARLESAWLGRGLLARLLWPLSLVFAVSVAARRVLHRLGIIRTAALDVPVLVVGNIIVGGAGKTPTVIACVKRLREAGYRPGIISRGYVPKGQRDAGTSADAAMEAGAPREVTAASLPHEVGDEPLLLKLRTGVPVVVGRDRVAAARLLRARHPEVDLIVSDDGLQHLALPRRASVLVFDERGTGNGWLLPAGPLREPLPTQPDASRLVLYNAPKASTPLPGFLGRPRLAGAVALQNWWSGSEAPSMDALQALVVTDPRSTRRIVAAAGVARPERFFSMLQALGLAFERLALQDHHPFAPGQPLPWPADTTDVLVTEKDAVKLRPEAAGGARVWVVALDFHPEPAFDDALRSLFPPH